MNNGPTHSSFENHSKKELIYLLEAYEEALNRQMLCSIINPKGVVKYANRKLSEVSQYSNKELVGADQSLVNSGLHPAPFFKSIIRTLKKGKTWQGEIIDKSKDGKLYWVKAVIIPMKDENGNIYQYLSLKTLFDKNIKASLKAEKKLYRLYERLVNTTDKMTPSLEKCIKQLDDYEKRGNKNSPEDLQRVFTSVRKSMVGLIDFKATVSELLLER